MSKLIRNNRRFDRKFADVDRAYISKLSNCIYLRKEPYDTHEKHLMCFCINSILKGEKARLFKLYKNIVMPFIDEILNGSHLYYASINAITSNIVEDEQLVKTLNTVPSKTDRKLLLKFINRCTNKRLRITNV